MCVYVNMHSKSFSKVEVLLYFICMLSYCQFENIYVIVQNLGKQDVKHFTNYTNQ